MNRSKSKRMLAAFLCVCMIAGNGILPLEGFAGYTPLRRAADVHTHTESDAEEETEGIWDEDLINDLATDSNALEDGDLEYDLATGSNAELPEGVIVEIEGYEDEDTPMKRLQVLTGTQREELKLPETLRVTVLNEDGEESDGELPVTWEEEGEPYAGMDGERTEFYAQWDEEEYPLAEGFRPKPYILVEVGDYPPLSLLSNDEDVAASFLFSSEDTEQVEEILDREIPAAHKEETSFFDLFRAAGTDELYRFSNYYINYKNNLGSVKTDTEQHLYGNGVEPLQLIKVQYDFSNDVDYEEEAVEVRVPRVLYHDRDGAEVEFCDIGVPEAPGSNRSSSFNYRIEGDDIVLVNCKKIKAGSNNFLQVFYALDDMMTVDGTAWEITPELTINGELQEGAGQTLTGSMDTEAVLTETRKIAYVLNLPEETNPDTDKTNLIYPEIYTKRQLSEALAAGRIGIKPEVQENFDDYLYLIWETRINGYASQPWNLTVKDTPGQDGIVLGQFLCQEGLRRPGEFKAIALTTNTDTLSWNNARRYGFGPLMSQDHPRGGRNHEVYVYSVVAYPKKGYENGTPRENTITVTLQGVDPGQEANEMASTAAWGWRPYHWKYHGEIIGIGKQYALGIPERISEASWLAVYKHNKRRGKDLALPSKWTVTGVLFGYNVLFPHNAENPDERVDMSEHMSYMLGTVDDFIYATGRDGKLHELGFEDYYYDQLVLQTEDYMLDIYENERNINQEGKDTSVWFMTAEDPETWTKYGDIPYTDMVSGYRVPQEWLDKGIYRVRLEYANNVHETYCTIQGKTVLRQGSPVINELLDELQTDGDDIVILQNLGGSYGKAYEDGVWDNNWLQQDDTADVQYGQYGEVDLMGRTHALYQDETVDGIPCGDMLPMRDNAFVLLTDLREQNNATKFGKAKNDAVNSQVKVTYQLAAWDGFSMYGTEGTQILEDGGVTPARRDGVFYDLLPLGISFDPSVPVTSGRLTYINRNKENEVNSWNTDGISVSYKVIDNYRGSGRQMVIFKVNCSEDNVDISAYTGGTYTWYSGWGIQFGAYYPWENEDLGNGAVNLMAYQVPGDILKGRAEKDNGTWAPLGAKEYLSDLDENGDTEERNIIWATGSVPLDSAKASFGTIEKTVKEDANMFGLAELDARVETGKDYTYYLTLTAGQNEMRELVIFDNLEDAKRIREGMDGEREFDAAVWTGTFAGVDTRPLEQLGIRPVVYYSSDRQEVIKEDGKTGQEVLKGGGWVPASEWNAPLSEVKAVACDISKNKAGEDFVLEELSSVMMEIHMRAPETFDPQILHAYNNPAYYGTVYIQGSKSSDTVIGNSTSVELYGSETATLAVEKKELVGKNAPEDTEFTFTVKINGTAYGYRTYRMFEKNSLGEYEEIETNAVHSTDIAGNLRLKAGQKAVFEGLPAGASYEVTEQSKIQWEAYGENTIGTLTVEKESLVSYTNTYYPPLYFDKLVQYTQSYTDRNTEFTFELTINGEKAKNRTWYRVDPAVSVKKEPVILGTDTTDPLGRFTLKAGERFCMPITYGDTYVFKEISGANGPDDDYSCDVTEVTGTIDGAYGYASITNEYQYKELLVTKEVIVKDGANPALVEDSFDFYVEIEGAPYKNQPYKLLNQAGKEINGDYVTDGAGHFTLKHGQTAKFQKVKKGAAYRVQETVPEGYVIVYPQDAAVTGNMPLYALNLKLTFRNKKQLRDLQVGKTVLYGEEQKVEATAKEFTFTIKINDEIHSGKPFIKVSGTTRTEAVTSETGTFTLKDGEKALFQDLPVGTRYEVTEAPETGYVQTEPAKGAAAVGEVKDDLKPTEVSFVNSTMADLTVTKNVQSESGAEPDTAGENQEFRFRISVQDELLVSREFAWTSADGQPGTKETDAEGKFSLRHGESARFTDLPTGLEYKVTELGLNDYTQITPANGLPATGTLVPGSKAAFVNKSTPGTVGKAEPLVLEKQVVPGENCEQEFLDEIMRGFFENLTITDKGDGLPKLSFPSWVWDPYRNSYNRWMDLLQTRLVLTVNGMPYDGSYVVTSPDGRKRTYSHPFKGDKGESVIILFPREKVEITNLDIGSTYEVYEGVTGKDVPMEVPHSYNLVNTYCSIRQVFPEDMGGLSGVIQQENNYGYFENAINIQQGGDGIVLRKYVTDETGVLGNPLVKYKVSERPGFVGATLTLQLLQSEDKETWYPAEGIKYSVLDYWNGGLSASPIGGLIDGESTANLCKWEYTDRNGRIVMRGYERSDGYYGGLDVYVDIPSSLLRDGIWYKLIEIAEETDSAFGEFVGLGSYSGLESYMTCQLVDTLKRETAFKVYKQVETENDDKTHDTFTFILKKCRLLMIGYYDDGYEEIVSNYPYRLFSIDGDKEIQGAFSTDEKGQFVLTDGQYALFEGIRTTCLESDLAGTVYRVTEAIKPGYETRVEVVDGNVISGVNGQYKLENNEGLIAPGTSGNLKFINRYDPTPSLRIQKKIEGNDTSSSDVFRFALDVDGKPYANREYEVYNLNTGAKIENKKRMQIGGIWQDIVLPWETDEYGEFTLQPNQYALFSWIGAGKKYEIWEVDSGKYTQVSPAPGTSITGVMDSMGKTETFINRADWSYITDTITVRKFLTLPPGLEAPAETFRFKLEVQGAEWAMKDYQIQTIAGVQIGSGYTNAMGEFTLEADQKAVFKDIPVGVDYKVEELLPEDSPYELLKATGTEGATLQAGVTADFTNAIGGFAVAKTVVGEYGQTPPEDDDFTFEVTCDGALLADHPYRLYGVFGEEIRDQEYRTSSAGEFSLKAGQRALFTGFARNTQYQIREKAKLFYTQTIPAKGAAWNGVIGDTVETLLFENQYSKNAALAIRKEVEDPGALGVSESDAFTFRLKVDGRPYAGKVYTLNDSTEPYRTMEDGTFQIRNGDTAHFDDLLDEARCVIEEIAMPDGYEEVETGPVEILVTSGAEHVFVKKNRKVPTIWVENTTGDDTEDNSDDNRGGTVLVLDDSGQEVTGSRHKVNSGSDDGTENRMNTKGRYTQKAVAGEPEEGWQVDTEQVTIGLKGMDGISGAHQQISGLPQTEAPGADGDYYSPDTGQFRYTQALPDGTSRTLTGEITEDRSTGMVKISFDPMDYDVDVGIPFKKRSYTMPKTGGTGTLPFALAGFLLTALPAAGLTRRRCRKRRPETEEPV